jgi:predicted lipid-binding transport protein (Tim44 family)
VSDLPEKGLSQMNRQHFTSILASLAVALSGMTLSVVSTDAMAKRLGGGRPAGMQRQMPAKPANTSPPAQQATPNTAPGQQASPAQAAPAMGAAQAAAQPAKRSWMGPIAGIAAGLGLAALASHFGFGEQLGNFMMMALLAVVAMVAIGWVMRRMRGTGAGGPQLAGAGAPYAASRAEAPSAPVTPMAREAYAAQPAAAAVASVAGGGTAAAAAVAQPEGFDAEGFTRVAKMIFIRLQAANDACNIEDLRKFTTPELFASLRLDLQERGGVAQQTDVMQLDAQLVDTVKEDSQWVATVRFSGLIREEATQDAQPFDELWHLVRPVAAAVNGQADWAIAGITPQVVA